MSLLDEFARPRRSRDDRPDPFGRLPEFLPEPETRPTFDDAFALAEPVGAEGRNRRDDVARIESLLGATGYLDLERTDGPTGFFGQRLDQAIRSFQKDHGLKVDGKAPVVVDAADQRGARRSRAGSAPHAPRDRADTAGRAVEIG